MERQVWKMYNVRLEWGCVMARLVEHRLSCSEVVNWGRRPGMPAAFETGEQEYSERRKCFSFIVLLVSYVRSILNL